MSIKSLVPNRRDCSDNKKTWTINAKSKGPSLYLKPPNIKFTVYKETDKSKIFIFG